MSSLVKHLASEAAEPFERLFAQIVRKGVPLFAAVACLATSAVFLTIALADFLHRTTGAEAEAAIIGGVYLCAAIIAFVIVARRKNALPNAGRGLPDARGESRPRPLESEARQLAPEPKQTSDFSRQIDGIIAPVLNILHDAGLERERAMLAAGAATAKELKPVVGVAFAIITGILIGRRLSKRP